MSAAAAFLMTGCVHTDRQTGGRVLEDLKVLQKKRIFFGHQSVGANILEGLREIEKQHGIILQIDDSLIGVNGDPGSKCEDFIRQMEIRAADTDIALMKFCYIDFDRTTDLRKLLNLYITTLETLQAEYPGVLFIPATAPLTTRPAAWRRVVKTILGRSGAASEISEKRNLFNELVKRHYASRVVFDIAGVESGNGTSLLEEYSDDGSHLNHHGREVSAENLIHTLATAVRASTARISPEASPRVSTAK